MKQKEKIFSLLAGLFIASLFISCNTNNKVVSSFGKRKYTKGFYFNSHSIPKVAAKPAYMVTENNIRIHTQIDSSGIRAVSMAAIEKDEKHPVENIGKKTLSKSISVNELLPRLLGAKDIFKNNSPAIKMPADTAQADNAPTDYRKYNREAIGGLLLGIACGCLIWTGFGLLLAIPGFFLSLWGLDSQKFHTLAVIGVVLNLIGLVALIVFLLVELIVIANGGGGA
jgi:hypothetical protein